MLFGCGVRHSSNGNFVSLDRLSMVCVRPPVRRLTAYTCEASFKIRLKTGHKNQQPWAKSTAMDFSILRPAAELIHIKAFSQKEILT